MDTRLSALYSALSKDLIEETGKDCDFYKSLPHLIPDLTYAEACGFSLTKALGKKFAPKTQSELNRAAMLKFQHANYRCRDWVLKLNTSGDEELWGAFRNALYNFFNPKGFPLVDELDSVWLHGRVGPGAAIGATGGDIYSKMFASQLTFTSPLLRRHYVANCGRFPVWFMAELYRSVTHGDPLKVEGSKLSFVPKSSTISRIICIEPTLSMYYQLGVGRIIEKRLATYFSIRLDEQPDFNRELARKGSDDGSLATIDLESASDTISYELCRQALPKEVMSILDACRSPMYSYGDSRDRFHMISTMGNGFTFPLQTCIFAAAVSAVYNVHGRTALFGPGQPCGVFGDDIIVHSDMYERVVSFLHTLGFVVNREKSFYQGPFRESCGRDYYYGRNIRGVYATRLDTEQDFYALANSFNAFSARCGIRLRHCVRLLWSWCRSKFCIPPTEDPSSGLMVPLNLVPNKTLGRHTQGVAYTCYVFEPRKVRIGDCYIRTPKGVKRRAYNPYGLLISFLSGMTLEPGLPWRDAGKWVQKRRYCSFWDSLPPETTLKGGVQWAQWKTAIFENLYDYEDDEG